MTGPPCGEVGFPVLHLLACHAVPTSEASTFREHSLRVLLC